MARYRARETFRFGPYFRHYAAAAGGGRGSRIGFTSHGFRFRTPLGPVTYNLTTRRWTWNNPGPGSVSSR